MLYHFREYLVSHAQLETSFSAIVTIGERNPLIE